MCNILTCQQRSIMLRVWQHVAMMTPGRSVHVTKRSRVRGGLAHTRTHTYTDMVNNTEIIFICILNSCGWCLCGTLTVCRISVLVWLFNHCRLQIDDPFWLVVVIICYITLALIGWWWGGGVTYQHTQTHCIPPIYIQSVEYSRVSTWHICGAEHVATRE